MFGSTCLPRLAMPAALCDAVSSGLPDLYSLPQALVAWLFTCTYISSACNVHQLSPAQLPHDKAMTVQGCRRSAGC